MTKTHTINLTTEEIGHAIGEYVRTHIGKTAYRLHFNVQTEMTDNAEPSATGKLVGVSIQVLDY